VKQMRVRAADIDAVGDHRSVCRSTGGKAVSGGTGLAASKTMPSIP